MKYPGYVLSDTLPSKDEVCRFTDELTRYLFHVTNHTDEFLQQHHLQHKKLQQQLTTLIHSVDNLAALDADNIVFEFFSELPNITEHLLRDAQLILEFDPAASSVEEVLLSYPGFSAIMVHRLAHPLYLAKVPLIPRMMSEWAHSKTGIDINPGASIGCPFFIDHGTGVVIGETAIIGDNVKIYQGVTLGALAVRKEDAKSKRHPTIEDNVIIYAGSTILGGNTTIGHDSIIGGNTWITKSIPPFSVVYHKNQIAVNDRKDFEEPINFII
ncbi:MAG TPA: serine O-acetyltransferase EpsC [Chitinophagaceae bacterium]|nr:serine O-acetyltransferase EpsC [Chitinophagaceae bacterium]